MYYNRSKKNKVYQQQVGIYAGLLIDFNELKLDDVVFVNLLYKKNEIKIMYTTAIFNNCLFLFFLIISHLTKLKR